MSIGPNPTEFPFMRPLVDIIDLSDGSGAIGVITWQCGPDQFISEISDGFDRIASCLSETHEEAEGAHLEAVDRLTRGLGATLVSGGNVESDAQDERKIALAETKLRARRDPASKKIVALMAAASGKTEDEVFEEQFAKFERAILGG